MARALDALAAAPQHLLLDALLLRENDLPQTALVRGDSRSLSIAAASVLAKTSRDAWMIECASAYPDYAFERHKGYGTRLHQEALTRVGACPQHRFSFAPLKQSFIIYADPGSG
jgi:ribonuclease HII